MERTHDDYGIFSWKKMSDAINYVSEELSCDSVCLGEVYSWGKIQEFSEGYQSEFAYPKKLFIINNYELAQVLQRKYGCEVKNVQSNNVQINKNLYIWMSKIFKPVEDFFMNEEDSIIHFTLKYLFLLPAIIFIIIPKFLLQAILQAILQAKLRDKIIRVIKNECN